MLEVGGGRDYRSAGLYGGRFLGGIENHRGSVLATLDPRIRRDLIYQTHLLSGRKTEPGPL